MWKIAGAVALLAVFVIGGHARAFQNNENDSARRETAAPREVTPRFHKFRVADFRREILGRSKREVLDVLGKPSSIGSNSDGVYYAYNDPTSFLLVDEDTGIVATSVLVFFDSSGRVRSTSVG